MSQRCGTCNGVIHPEPPYEPAVTECPKCGGKGSTSEKPPGARPAQDEGAAVRPQSPPRVEHTSGQPSRVEAERHAEEAKRDVPASREVRAEGVRRERDK